AQNWLNIEGYKQNTRFLNGLSLQHRISKFVTNKTTLFGGFYDSFERRPFNNLDERMGSYGARSQFMFTKKSFSLVSGAELFAERYSWRTFLDQNNSLNTTADI